jgi:hypothetical protein
MSIQTTTILSVVVATFVLLGAVAARLLEDESHLRTSGKD